MTPLVLPPPRRSPLNLRVGLCLFATLGGPACEDEQDPLGAPDAGAADRGDSGTGLPDAETVDSGPDLGMQSQGTVEECQAAVDIAFSVCSGETSRECIWGVWRDQCERGTDDVIREAAACFAEDAEDGFCRSLGDPGTSENIACTNAALARARTTAAEASIAALCEACPTQPDLCIPSGNGSFGAPFEFLPDEEQPALQACLGTAQDCDAAIQCAVAAFEGLDACVN